MCSAALARTAHVRSDEAQSRSFTRAQSDTAGQCKVYISPGGSREREFRCLIRRRLPVLLAIDRTLPRSQQMGEQNLHRFQIEIASRGELAGKAR